MAEILAAGGVDGSHPRGVNAAHPARRDARGPGNEEER